MKIGFIGMGNMAKAIASGFIASRKIQKENIFAFAPNQEKLKKMPVKLDLFRAKVFCPWLIHAMFL